jgi:hypothetical protein
MKRLLVSIVLAACGGSSGDSLAEWVPDDVDSSATVDRLGAAGFARVCTAFDDYVRDTYRSNVLIQAACTAHAVETTADAVACGATLESCLDTLPPVVEEELDAILDQAGCTALGVEPTGCSSTVSAFTDCLDALGAQLDTIELSLTCAAAGSPVPEDWYLIEAPEECYAIIRGC